MNALLQTLSNRDYPRGPIDAADKPEHKEWFHFCVRGRELDLVINFSLVSEGGGHKVARVTALARARAWDGDLDRYTGRDVRVRDGTLDLQFGENFLRLEDGVYRIALRLARRPISVELELRPLVLPSVANNIPLDRGVLFNWLVVPRLEANGTVELDGERHVLSGAPTYHDHNWGHFSWGSFAWEWGFALPSDLAVPWSVVFARLVDRAHTSVLSQALFLWRGADHFRVLRGHELRVSSSGPLRARPILKLPRVMGLLAPGIAPDVPAHLEVAGQAGDDELRVRFDAEDLVQVVVPNDGDLGLTIINEVNGRVALDGCVRGQRVEAEGHAVFEFLGA